MAAEREESIDDDVSIVTGLGVAMVHTPATLSETRKQLYRKHLQLMHFV